MVIRVRDSYHALWLAEDVWSLLCRARVPCLALLDVARRTGERCLVGVWSCLALFQVNPSADLFSYLILWQTKTN